MMLLSGATVATGVPGEAAQAATIRVAGGRFESVESVEPFDSGEPAAGVPGADAVDLTGMIVLPGFVDQHCHGGGGGDFFAADRQQALTAARTHLDRGTTSVIASLVTATEADLRAQITCLAPLVDDGTLAGIHLEGPWISTHQCGAHDKALLRPPDLVEVAGLLEHAGGRIRMVTIAPELPGGLDAIGYLAQHGAVAAIGHTDCDYGLARRAIDAGATAATHLLNRMRPLDKRHPGPVLALVEDPRVTVELIADGVHLHPSIVRFFAETSGWSRTAVVTDAMGAAGGPDGDYLIGQLEVVVADGVARLARGGALAGSTLTMDRALRVLVHRCGLELAEAAQVLCSSPAHAMGLADVGAIAPGRRADLVVLDQDLLVRRVMRAGEWVE